MELYLERRVLVGDARLGRRADLDDIRRAANEFGCVVLPSSFISFVDLIEKHIEEKADIRLSHLVLIRKALTQAAEAMDDG